ncbi:hypothetical protein FRC04_006662 [Tulasnella sp. 424]|nr:hypothetical protein FRC04_006662 [Tulasnella sp. 424]KAG8975311.1 hypothetical protein FRC05_005869 [Tulasnella sp. 425]
MTRTERANSPRALLKDRHVSKTGMDKSIRKSGGGAHNWGSPLDQYDDSELYDEGFDEEESTAAAATSSTVQAAAEDASPKDRRRSSISASSTEEHATVNNEEKEKALAFRKRALSKGDIDLAAIARTSSAASTAK